MPEAALAIFIRIVYYHVIVNHRPLVKGYARIMRKPRRRLNNKQSGDCFSYAIFFAFLAIFSLIEVCSACRRVFYYLSFPDTAVVSGKERHEEVRKG